jgi:hypothetical protein
MVRALAIGKRDNEASSNSLIQAGPTAGDEAVCPPYRHGQVPTFFSSIDFPSASPALSS